MNIYLDIDGVLLTKKGEPVFYVEEFLKYITDNYDCYWLTTHCKGNAEYAERYLSRTFNNNKISDLLKKIKPTNWDTLKTEAINFSKDFKWIDDCVFQGEIEVLKKQGAINKLILVDLEKEPESLRKIVELLTE